MFFAQADASNFIFQKQKNKKWPKFSVKYSHVMADLEIKFHPL
jgi:hypothetical protein